MFSSFWRKFVNCEAKYFQLPSQCFPNLPGNIVQISTSTCKLDIDTKVDIRMKTWHWHWWEAAQKCVKHKKKMLLHREWISRDTMNSVNNAQVLCMKYPQAFLNIYIPYIWINFQSLSSSSYSWCGGVEWGLAFLFGQWPYSGIPPVQCLVLRVPPSDTVLRRFNL